MTANAEVQFAVADARLEADTKFRMVGETGPRYAYGDDQFSPTILRVVTTHFADAFPRDLTATQLMVERLEVVDYVPRPLGNGRWCQGEAALFCLPIVLIGRAVTDHNSVTCYLAGSYAGIAFSSSATVIYDEPGSMEHSKAVAGSLLAATTNAIREVRAQRHH